MSKVKRDILPDEVSLGEDLLRAREVAEISSLKLGDMLAKVASQSNYVASEVLIQAVLEDCEEPVE